MAKQANDPKSEPDPKPPAGDAGGGGGDGSGNGGGSVDAAAVQQMVDEAVAKAVAAKSGGGGDGGGGAGDEGGPKPPAGSTGTPTIRQQEADTESAVRAALSKIKTEEDRDSRLAAVEEAPVKHTRRSRFMGWV